MSRSDLVLSIVTGIATLALLIVFFTSQPFFDWAFERHQNVASWVARPLLVLPLCYTAWKRWLSGVLASVLVILSSMFWFPVPEAPREDVLEFLAMEREILSQGWSAQNILGLGLVALYIAALSAAFWRRSWKLGFAVAAGGAVLKSLWSVIFSPQAGQAVLPFAIGGVVVLGLVLWPLHHVRSRHAKAAGRRRP